MSRSLVAGVNALFRARETARRHGRVLDDPWAGALAEKDPRVLAIRFVRFVVPPLLRTVSELQTAHVVRHRAIDVLVERAISEGFSQIVIVGAGYDMRASRFAKNGVRWIEADEAETQARKLRLLASRRDARHVERVPVDLSKGSLRDALARTAYVNDAPTCFVAEGLIHYLDERSIDDLLATFARPPRARVILSFIDEAMVKRATPTFVRLIKTVREVPSTYFYPSEIGTLGARFGFARARVWSYAEQVDELAPEARGRTPPPLTQHVAQLDR